MEETENSRLKKLKTTFSDGFQLRNKEMIMAFFSAQIR